jgi:hypothetical protein
MPDKNVFMIPIRQNKKNKRVPLLPPCSERGRTVGNGFAQGDSLWD